MPSPGLSLRWSPIHAWSSGPISTCSQVWTSLGVRWLDHLCAGDPHGSQDIQDARYRAEGIDVPFDALSTSLRSAADSDRWRTATMSPDRGAYRGASWATRRGG